MIHFTFPSDQDRADNDDLERVCDQLEQCLVENDRLRDALADRDALLATYKEKLEKAEAQVERLRQTGNRVINYGENPAQWASAVLETPAQALVAVRSEAVESAIPLYTHKLRSEFEAAQVDIIRKGQGFIHPEGLQEYANQIRNGEA